MFEALVHEPSSDPDRRAPSNFVGDQLKAPPPGPYGTPRDTVEYCVDNANAANFKSQPDRTP